MEDNIAVLVDAKIEYTKQLTNILVPFIHEGIKSIHEDVSLICVQNNDEKILMRFQENLALIPKWNQQIIDEEFERIKCDSGCDWLDELITAVFLSHTKILTVIRNNKKQKKINLKIPKIDHFIHKCYIESAREFWKNPYLFSSTYNACDIKRNERDAKNIIRNCIEETIRKLLPVKNILREYLGNSYEESEGEEGSLLPETYRDNLRKLVKKEIEICQNRKEVNITDKTDDESIEELVEVPDRNIDSDLSEIKEIISTELYDKNIEDSDNSLESKGNDINIESVNLNEMEEKIETDIESIDLNMESINLNSTEINNLSNNENSIQEKEISSLIINENASENASESGNTNENNNSIESGNTNENNNSQNNLDKRELKLIVENNSDTEEEDISTMKKKNFDILNLDNLDELNLNDSFVENVNEDFNIVKNTLKSTHSELETKLESNNKLNVVEKEQEQELEKNIKTIVIEDDSKNKLLRKFTREKSKNYKFFE